MVEYKQIKAVGSDGQIQRMAFLYDTIQCPSLKAGVAKACEDYFSTREGNRLLPKGKELCNWQDFWNFVPNDICMKYGFRKLEEYKDPQVVEMTEPLIVLGALSFPYEEWERLKQTLIKQKLCQKFLYGYADNKALHAKKLENEQYAHFILDFTRPRLAIDYLQQWYVQLFGKLPE